MDTPATLNHRTTCDPLERSQRSCPCGVTDAWIDEAVDHYQERIRQLRVELARERAAL
jgi:hypothetical protein